MLTAVEKDGKFNPAISHQNTLSSLGNGGITRMTVEYLYGVACELELIDRQSAT